LAGDYLELSRVVECFAGRLQFLFQVSDLTFQLGYVTFKLFNPLRPFSCGIGENAVRDSSYADEQILHPSGDRVVDPHAEFTL